MNHLLKHSLRQQFGASITMLKQAIQSAPEKLFTYENRFYHLAYHSLLFLDYYLTIPPKDFSPQLPFQDAATVTPEMVGDIIPQRLYSKTACLAYLDASRIKCYNLIRSLTEESLQNRFQEDFEVDAMDYSILEILLYNMRHTQHHVGQLYLMLRQENQEVPKWVFQADET